MRLLHPSGLLAYDLLDTAVLPFRSTRAATILR